MKIRDDETNNKAAFDTQIQKFEEVLSEQNEAITHLETEKLMIILKMLMAELQNQ